MEKLKEHITDCFSLLIITLIICIFLIAPLVGAGVMFVKFCFCIFNGQYIESMISLFISFLLLTYVAKMMLGILEE